MEGVTSKKIKFSDDGTIYESAKIEGIPQLTTHMKENLIKIMPWCNKWHMPINQKKTKCMLYSKDPVNTKINLSLDIKKSDSSFQTLDIAIRKMLPLPTLIR